MTSASGRDAPRTEAVGACPLCQSACGRTFFEGPDRLHGTPGTFQYRRCGGCESVFQDPRVVDDDVSGLYPADYYTHDSPVEAVTLPDVQHPGAGLRGWIRRGVQAAVVPGGDSGAASPHWAHRGLAKSRWIRERAFFDLVPAEMLPGKQPPGRALDVGCGSGANLLRLAALGWKPEGAEWDPAAAEVARARTGMTVHVGGVEALGPELGSFDLVTLVHVFEHLARPTEALAAVARILAPRGRLVLVYPNPNSLGARRFSEFWFAWDAPRHLVFPTPAGLRVAARRAGMRVRSSRTLARWAPMHAFQSRRYRRGEPHGPLSPGVGDRAFHALERVLIQAGAPVGEEIVASLEVRR